jgi:hypothetical protein
MLLHAKIRKPRMRGIGLLFHSGTRGQEARQREKQDLLESMGIG